MIDRRFRPGQSCGFVRGLSNAHAELTAIHCAIGTLTPCVRCDVLLHRVEPDAIKVYKVLFDAANASLPANVSGLQGFQALVQIDAFSSTGAVVRRNYFHDSCVRACVRACVHVCMRV